MKITRLLPNIVYVDLLDFVVGTGHIGWYLQLVSPTDPRLQIGIVRQDAEKGRTSPMAYDRRLSAKALPREIFALSEVWCNGALPGIAAS